MTYSPEYDRLLLEARALAAEQAAVADAVPAGDRSPRGQAAAAHALLALRSRLSAVLAGIADGQAGATSAWMPEPFAPVAEYPALGEALASVEQRLAAARR